MTKRIDPDVKALRAAVKALLATSPRMRRSTLEFLWDRFITRERILDDEHRARLRQEVDR